MVFGKAPCRKEADRAMKSRRRRRAAGELLEADPCHLEGHGDLVRSLIRGITRATIWVIGVIHLLTKSPCPSK